MIADLREIFDEVRKDYRKRERAANARMPVLRAASIMAQQPDIRPSQLAEALRLERSTVSNMLRDMRGKGLIRRQKLHGDGRYACLQLTERGRALLRRAGRAGNGLLVRAVDRLAPEAARRLLSAIGPLVLAVRADRPIVLRRRRLRRRQAA